MYDIGSISVKYAEKNKCGDAVKIFDEDNYVLLILSDGVSSCSDDNKASQKTIEFFEEYFKDSVYPIEEKMSRVVNLSNRALSAYAKNKTLMSTLVALYWEKKSNDIHYVSIGDSRLYKMTSKGVTALTNDDTIREMKSNFITQAMGTKMTLDPKYTAAKIVRGDLLVLCSDGFYELNNFKRIVNYCYRSKSIQSALDSKLSDISSMSKDDASVIMFRVMEEFHDDILYRECVESGEDFEKAGITSYQILEYIYHDFMKSKDEKAMLLEMEYLYEFNLHYSREEYIVMLEKAIETESVELVDMIKKMIMKS